MRRADRQVQDPQEVFDILQRCDTLRIAMRGEKYPYIVPVSFGAEIQDGTPVVYFHCAPQGMKVDLLQADPYVSVEGDILIRIEKLSQGITARYESVIGFGQCRFLEDIDEKVHALNLLVAHYGHSGYPVDSCPALQHLVVGKIVLDQLTGKKNLPAG